MENTTHIHFRAETDSDNIVWLHFDKADGGTNVLNFEVFEQLDRAPRREAAPGAKRCIAVERRRRLRLRQIGVEVGLDDGHSIRVHLVRKLCAPPAAVNNARRHELERLSLGGDS